MGENGAKKRIYPWIPVVGRGAIPKESEAVQRAVRYVETSPLFTEDPWTKSVPIGKAFDDEAKPSESIAAAYTPAASKIRFKKFPKKEKKKENLPMPVNENGELVYPPAGLFRQREQQIAEKKEKEEEKIVKRSTNLDLEPENTVSLATLADDTWLRRKAEKKEAEILKKRAINIAKKRCEMKAKIEREKEVNSTLFYFPSKYFQTFALIVISF